MVMMRIVREVRMFSRTGHDSPSVQVKTCGVIQRRNLVLENYLWRRDCSWGRRFMKSNGRRLLRSWLGQVSSSLRFAGVVLRTNLINRIFESKLYEASRRNM